MYVFEFLQRLIKKKNVGIIVYLIINIFIVINLLSSFFPNNMILGILFGTAVYIVSVSVALSPVGEWILRRQTGCREIERADYKERLIPLFEEVYSKAKEKDLRISTDIKLYMNNDMQPNAFATGRNTICLTRGLLNYSDEEIKAIFAHEFGHLHYKDTDSLLLITVGNFIVTSFFVVSRLIFRFFGFTFAIVNRSWGAWILTLLMDVIYVGMFNLWTWLGTMLVLHSSRGREYEADKFAFDTGYGNSLAQALDKIGTYSGERSKGLFATLMSSHPETDSRIAKLQELGATYRRIFS